MCAANGLAGFPLGDDQLVQLASAFEGHPDNAAASILGGAVVSWTNVPIDGHSEPKHYAVGVKVHEAIKATAFVPDFHASTEAVRRVLPSDVSHLDARFNVSRTAVMTIALQHDPSLLWEGTRDRLHQTYRAEVLPITAEWVNRLRNLGYPAFLSGAGQRSWCCPQRTHQKLKDEAIERGIRVLELEVAQCRWKLTARTYRTCWITSCRAR